MKQVIVREEMVTIPTYQIADYDKNPMFLEKRVYQGSCGKVYPHPVCEGVADEKTDKQYQAVFLENDYILVMILPEIGGKIQRLYDKTNGYDAVYYNEVVKPALVGLAGPWISGGIEFNWPQHHRPSTFDPVDYTIVKGEDGSVTVWVGETEKMFHTKGMMGYTVYPDRAYVEIHGQVYNPTDRPQTFLWWANPAVAVNEETQSIFPPDVNAVMDHGKRGVSKFPIADGVYYKVDYAPGTDISRYKNIPVPTSYMAYHSDYNFIGNYDYGKAAGLLHIADHHISPGKKQWTWGNGDFGQAWDRNLTDENGPYIELMTGMFTDNQPDFTFLKPYEGKNFVQYFMPYRTVGEVKNASTEIVAGMTFADGKIRLALYAPQRAEDLAVTVAEGEKVIFDRKISLGTAESFEETLDRDAACSEEAYRLSICAGEKEILSYQPKKNSEEIPSPAEAIPDPAELPTTEKLFLAATHLEQYRHATYSPEPYYLEGLKRDPSDIRLNNGYGKYLYQRGRFAESEKHFREAVKASTWKNPNPYDCEPYFNLGLALKRQGKTAEAFDAFYKAVWDGSMQDKAFYQLACIASEQGRYEEALFYVEQSLARGIYNLKARTLKTALLRILSRKDEAVSFAGETERIDRLDHGCRYELMLLTGEGKEELVKVMRGENHNYIELALTYMEAGLKKEAEDILAMAPVKDEPMVHYYLFAVTGKESELKAAEEADSLYCFPNRLEDIGVLETAHKAGGVFAAYYLGELFYDRGRVREAARLWEECTERWERPLPTVYRNLALAYYNHAEEVLDAAGDALSDLKAKKAREAIEKAYALDETDARIFFEQDQLYKITNVGHKERLAKMEEHAKLLEKRDDLYTEYITLLNMDGQTKKAYECIMEHKFHPWEGGEGKIPAQYRKALMRLAEGEADEKAKELLMQALSYPHNLGEGKLIGNLDNDLYYLLAKREQDEKQRTEYLKLAARGSFELGSAMYYNDQPPEMMYYAALALRELGDVAEAERRFHAMKEYATEHDGDTIKIEYFAVSLPDFLIFNADLDRKNKVHCCYMGALGCMGLGDAEGAKEKAEEGLKLDSCHAGLMELLREIPRL